MFEPAVAMVPTRDGTRLAVESVGEGPVVLMLPGLGYGSWSWCRQIPDLAIDHQVVAVSNRGSGQSDKPTGPYSIEQMAEDSAEILDGLGAGPAHVVGASMGGYIALTLAVRHPSLVKSLVLVATSVGGPGSTGVPISTLDAWTSSADLPPSEFARQTMSLSFRDGWTEENPVELDDLLSRRLEAPTPMHAWASQLAACEDFLRVGLPQGALIQPTLIIHGTEDRVVPYANSAETLRRIPQSELLTLKGAGHLCWIEEAELVNQAIRSTVTRTEIMRGNS